MKRNIIDTAKFVIRKLKKKKQTKWMKKKGKQINFSAKKVGS